MCMFILIYIFIWCFICVVFVCLPRGVSCFCFSFCPATSSTSRGWQWTALKPLQGGGLVVIPWHEDDCHLRPPSPSSRAPVSFQGDKGTWDISSDVSARTKLDLAHVPQTLWDMGHLSDKPLLGRKLICHMSQPKLESSFFFLRWSGTMKGTWTLLATTYINWKLG